MKNFHFIFIFILTGAGRFGIFPLSHKGRANCVLFMGADFFLKTSFFYIDAE